MLMRAWRAIGHTALDFALPPRCPSCRDVIDQPHLLCAPCWAKMGWIGVGCTRCGLPLEAGAMDECGACLAKPPPFDRIRSAVAYGEMARALVVRMKYGRKVGLAETLARTMAPLVGDEPALLVPVPLHRWRLWNRGFNQSLLLARALERAGKGRVEPHLLRRTRATRPLKGLNATQRRNETNGAFGLARPIGDLAGQRIILVDDVLTSGSTADACARTLRKAGARRIELLTFARVVAGAARGTGDMA